MAKSSSLLPAVKPKSSSHLPAVRSKSSGHLPAVKNTFKKTLCSICKNQISIGGAAYTSHMRMHVKNNEAIEFKTSKGLKFMPEAEYRDYMDRYPYALVGEEPLPGQPKEVWEIPPIAESLPAIDPSGYFITSGEAVDKADKLVQDLYSLAVKARAFRDTLKKARGKRKYLETSREDKRLLVKCKDPRVKKEKQEKP